MGVALGGVAVGAGTALSGFTVAGLAAGSTNMTGLSVAGGYMRIEDGTLRGVSIAGYNDIRGHQRGLTIGLFNYARHLHGVQLGLINVARNNPPAATVLPVVNLNL